MKWSIVVHSKAVAEIQEQIAARMKITLSVIACLESGKSLPNIKTLAKYAKATGQHLHVSLGD